MVAKAMRAPKEHLAYLLQLAAEPGARQELVRELAELLTAWPPGYPAEVRASFAALLARAEQDIDPEVRRELAVKLARCPDAPLTLLNEFFFDVPADARRAILARDAQQKAAVLRSIDEAALVTAVRTKRGNDLINAFAVAFGIDRLTATEILQDPDGMGIAIACRGAAISRATYSTLVVLIARGEMSARLDAFDEVPEQGAAAMLAFWREHMHLHPEAA